MKPGSTILPCAFVALGLAAAPAFAAGVAVRDIQVQNLSGPTPGAISNWHGFSNDLKQAIATRLGGRMSPNGYDLDIRITSADMASAAAPSKLTGVVQLVLPAQPSGNGDAQSVPSVERSYDLTVSAHGAGQPSMAQPDETAMVNSFADYVVAHL